MSIQAMLAAMGGGPIKLPHSGFPAFAKRAIVEACCVAWKRLNTSLTTSGGSIATLDEDAISIRMKEILNFMLRETPSAVRGFSAQLFETVVRDATVFDYNETSLEKKPDLVFRMIDPRPGIALAEYRALFAECKMIDGKSRTTPLYCAKGILRFVNGEYAWAMPCALMIAYVLGSQSIDIDLHAELLRNQGADPDPYQTNLLPAAAGTLGPFARRTSHGRQWAYLSGGSPGDIEITHVWLS